MFKVNNKNTRTTSLKDVVPVLLLLTMNIFHIFSSVSIVDFEQVNFVGVNSSYCILKNFLKLTFQKLTKGACFFGGIFREFCKINTRVKNPLYRP